VFHFEYYQHAEDTLRHLADMLLVYLVSEYCRIT